MCGFRSMSRWVAIAVVGWTVACVSATDGLQSQLRDATSTYNRSMRWGDLDRAAEYIPAASQQAFIDRHEQLGTELTIVDYELTRLDLDPGRGVATSRAEIMWHTDRELVVRTTAVDQLWQFFHGQFVLVDEHRSSGTPLSIFANPEDKPHPYLPGLEAFRKANEIGEENKPQRKRSRKSQAGEAPSAPAAAG